MDDREAAMPPFVEEKRRSRQEGDLRGGAHGRVTYRPFVRRINRVREALADRAERRIHDARRMARHGTFAVEDGLDGVILRIRRDPATAVAIAFVAGGVAALTTSLLIRARRPQQQRRRHPNDAEDEMLANTPQVAERREQTRKQRVRVRGEELLAKVRELIHEGNARRIIVIGDDGPT
jgi:hypothetical protein